MNADNQNAQTPPRIRAAFDYLRHVFWITHQTEASIPRRPLTALEKSVETAALRAVQQYLLGEMDFEEKPVEQPKKQDDGDGGDAQAVEAK